MAGKYSIYKYVKLAGKGWRYARAVYHPNGKIKPDAVLVKDVNGKNVEEKHPEGSYFVGPDRSMRSNMQYAQFRSPSVAPRGDPLTGGFSPHPCGHPSTCVVAAP